MLNVQKNGNKNDGHPSGVQGKEARGQLEGMGKDVAGGALNYKSKAGSEKKVGK